MGEEKPEAAAPKLIGFMGVTPDDFEKAGALGARTVACSNPSNAAELRQCLDRAARCNLLLLVKGPGRNAFLTPEKKIDFARVTSVLDTYFKGNDLAGHASLGALWLVDEPAHPQKYDLDAEELWRLYQTVKGYDRRIQLMINLGDLGHCDKFMKTARPGWRFADIVMFTVTQRKLEREAGYLERQAEAAKRIGTFDPKVRILPGIAVIEFVRSGHAKTPMPSPKWVETVASRCLKLESFTGLFLYSFSMRSRWMGRVIKDAVDQPEYRDAFKRILADAAAKALPIDIP